MRYGHLLGDTGINTQLAVWATGIRYTRNWHPASICYPPICKESLRISQIRLSLSSPTETYVTSKYGECLLPIQGEIIPRSCLPGNTSAILGCPNLEIPASDDQRCVCPSVSSHPSVCRPNRVTSVPPTILSRSISYLGILSSNFKRYVVWQVFKKWFFIDFLT